MLLKPAPLKRIKRNLFSSPFDVCISLLLFFLFGWFLSTTIHWIFVVADWSVVLHNIPLFAFGSYPTDQQWRPILWLSMMSILFALTFLAPRQGLLRKSLPLLWIFMLPCGVCLLAGGIGLLAIPSRSWGGLTLTLLLTICSASLALPIGILLALGRQNSLPVIQRSCMFYIDVMRSVPLIAVLFFGQLLIPLFLPHDLEVNRVLRAVVAFALFAAAYIAEDVRGGLQAIPNTQREAAVVLGLSQPQILQFVILPQALRIALPALTNQAVGLLQNTSLMAILGLVELLGIGLSLLANPSFIGRYLEVYVWLAVLYWIVCTAMALLSRHLEYQLNPTAASTQPS